MPETDFAGPEAEHLSAVEGGSAAAEVLRPPFSQEYLSNLVLNSFRFGQGNRESQQYVLEYLVLQHHDQIVFEDLKQIFTDLIPKAARFVDSDHHLETYAGVEKEMMIAWEAMRTAPVEESENHNRDSLVNTILAASLYDDCKNIVVDQNGRSRGLLRDSPM